MYVLCSVLKWKYNFDYVFLIVPWKLHTIITLQIWEARHTSPSCLHHHPLWKLILIFL